MCVTIKMVEGKIAWQLDQMNFSLTLYRTSQFMLSLLLAFRLVSSRYNCPAPATNQDVALRKPLGPAA